MRIVSEVLGGCLTSTPCRSPGRLTVQKASGTRRAPSIRWKAQVAPLSAESHCATVTLQPSLKRMRELLGFNALGSVSASVSNRLCLGRGHKLERLEGLVADFQNSHRDTMDRRADYLRSIARRSAACVSPGVLPNRALCLCPFCVSFSEISSSFQMGCNTKCALLMRCSVAA